MEKCRGVVVETPFQGGGDDSKHEVLRLRRAIPRGFAQDDNVKKRVAGGY
jgi:hypothetical protein